MKYRARWKPDAGGYVAKYAGQWAGPAYDDRDHLAAVVRASPNGEQLEIVEVEE